ncbi:hypothetical protein THRCLA_09268 [Thraustotheca clavata]|uniref:Rab-GAP TBC domain-containing protein n=1 Tax=Thraustotheca clavata TaxID=74557 RepID=A0A1V9YXP8_9STRA|nr:hypothetical protein THRCLA_09268 [Thraustotheca clavata]
MVINILMQCDCVEVHGANCSLAVLKCPWQWREPFLDERRAKLKRKVGDGYHCDPVDPDYVDHLLPGSVKKLFRQVEQDEQSQIQNEIKRLNQVKALKDNSAWDQNTTDSPSMKSPRFLNGSESPITVAAPVCSREELAYLDSILLNDISDPSNVSTMSFLTAEPSLNDENEEEEPLLQLLSDEHDTYLNYGEESLNFAQSKFNHFPNGFRIQKRRFVSSNMLSMRQLKLRTLSALGVAPALEDPSFEILRQEFTRSHDGLELLAQQVPMALVSCHSLCNTLLTTFSLIQAPANDYFTTLQQVREQAEALEQAVALTVLAPLKTHLQKCAEVREQLHYCDRLAMEYDMSKVDVSRMAEEVKIERLHRMEAAWQNYQTFTRQRMDDITQLLNDETQLRNEIFEIMKLHIAKFFNNANKTLWAKYDFTAKDAQDAIQEELPKSLNLRVENVPEALTEIPPASAAALISAPMLSPTPIPSPRRFTETSWFSRSRIETKALPSPPRVKQQSKQVALAPSEWLGIERTLWALDEQAAPYHPNYPLVTTFPFQLPTLHLFYDVCKYMDGISLIRLAMTCKCLYNGIMGSTALWHRMIRNGGIPLSVRNAFWLWFLYQKHSPPLLPSYISDYQALLQRGAYMVHLSNNLDSHDSILQEESKLSIWFNDIDIDVRRTCYKDVNTWAATEDYDGGDDGTLNADVAAIVEKAMIQHHHHHSPRHHDTAKVEKAMEMEAKMRRLLRAYVILNPRIGYCQGMNFIVRLLLENEANDEAAVFWTFVQLCEGSSATTSCALFDAGFHQLQTLFTKLDILIREQMPDLHIHMERQGVHVSMFAARWFLTLFSSLETFGPTLALRFLDLYYIDRHRVLCGMALVVLEELRELILESDFEMCLSILQCPRQYLPEPDALHRKQMIQHALMLSITRTLMIPSSNT